MKTAKTKPAPPTAAVTRSKIERRVTAACLLALVALGLIAWALISRKPIPVVVAMSVGQVIGTLSLALFLASVLLDVRATYKLSKIAPEPSPDAPSKDAPAPESSDSKPSE